ncbi:MAG: hypothetical protein R3B13_31110 [Polyangiaceae bacterium]
MKERSKGLLVLIGSAVAAGVIMEVRRDRTPAPAPSASTLPAASASAAPTPTYREVTLAELDATIAKLEARIAGPAGDDRHPWALAHGIVAFGKDFRAASGKRAVDVIATFAEQQDLEGKQYWGFPRRKGASLVEPHRHMLAKTLLEAGVPLSETLVTSAGKTLTLNALVKDLRASTRVPQDDTAWHDAAWTLSALAAADAAGVNARPGEVTTEQLATAALARLQDDDKVVSEYAGPLDRAFAPGSPLREAKAKKTGIYGHSCGGLHLVQAVLATQLAPDTEGHKRAKRQLGVLLFRYESERLVLQELLRQRPDQGLLLRVQRLKLYGHLVETLVFAQRWGFIDTQSEGGKKLRQLMLRAAADAVDVFAELDAGGVYQRLDAIARDREQTYLDLVGDACHAIRGLRGLRDLLAPPDAATP